MQFECCYLGKTNQAKSNPIEAGLIIKYIKNTQIYFCKFIANELFLNSDVLFRCSLQMFSSIKSTKEKHSPTLILAQP